MLLQFKGVSRPISLINGRTLLPVLAAVAKTWPVRRIARSRAAPVVVVRRGPGGFRIDSPWLEESAEDDSAVGAACCMLIDLVQAYVEDHPSLVCLHCAAVEIGGRLVLFPNNVRAGKTTLAVRLAAEGLRIFADDALPVDATRAEGYALGIAPRLRLPLPRRADAAFRAFVDAHGGPSDRRYRYLTLPPTMLAGHGSTAPLGAVVLLDRKRAGPAHLAAAPRGRGLRQLIVQNVAAGATSIGAVDRLHALMARLPCFALSYADVDDAAVLLRERLSEQPAPVRAPARRARHPAALDKPAGVQASGRRGAEGYRQSAGVHLREIDGDLFLVRPDRDGVFHLNTIAAALWRMLKRPTTISAAAAVLGEAFPGVGRRRISRDVKKAFDAMRRGGLISR